MCAIYIFKLHAYRKCWKKERSIIGREESWHEDRAFVLKNRSELTQRFGKGYLLIKNKEVLAYKPTLELAEIERYLMSYKKGIYLYSINIIELDH